MNINWTHCGVKSIASVADFAGMVNLSIASGHASMGASIDPQAALLIADEIRRVAVEIMDREHEAVQQRMREAAHENTD